MSIIIKNVKILYGENLDLRKNVSIYIKNGYIEEVNSNIEYENTAKIIDGEGQYVYPGLIDMHVHLMWDGTNDPVSTLHEEGHEQMLIRATKNCIDYAKNGITTVRDVGSVDDIAIHVSKAEKKGLINGCRVIASGKTLTMTGGHDPFWARFVDGKDEALKGVREQIFKGAEVIKVSSTGGVYGRTEGEDVNNAELSLEEQTVICDEAHKFGLQVASHAIGREGIYNSIMAGVDTIEHGHFLDKDLIKLMEEKGIAWHPTLFVYDQISKDKNIPEYAREKALNIVEVHQNAFKEFHQSNLLIGAGSDAGSPNTPHKNALFEEIYLINKFTMNNKVALKTATVNAGKILKKNIGQIKEGFVADFILSKNNPLEDLYSIEGKKTVYRKGIQI